MVDFLQLKSMLAKENTMLFVISGHDEYLKSRAISTIRNVLTIENEMINVNRFVEENSLPEALNSIQTYPLFSPQKLVVVDCFAKEKVSKEALKNFRNNLDEFANLQDKETCLVIVSNDKIFSDLPNATFVNCDRLSTADVVSWILAKARQSKRTIDRLTAQTIADYCLCDMARVSVEMEKLCTFSEQEITLQMVESMVHKDSEFVVFNLTDAISTRSVEESMQILITLLSQGEEAGKIFGAIYSTFRRLYYLKTTEYSQNELANYLGVKPTAFYRLQEVVKRYKPMQLKKALELFEQADEKLKNFQKEKDVLEVLVMQLLAL